MKQRWEKGQPGAKKETIAIAQKWENAELSGILKLISQRSSREKWFSTLAAGQNRLGNFKKILM